MKTMTEAQENPIPVVLHCPHCLKQHVDEGVWATRPHRTHQCVDDCMGAGCGKAFTPSPHRTFGIPNLKGLAIQPLDESPEPKPAPIASARRA